MEFIIGLSCLVVGALLGFFVAKYVNLGDKSEQKALSEKEIKQLLAQQANAYVNETKQSLNSLGQQLQQLQNGLSAYEALITDNKGSSEESGINYYDEQASTYLRNKQTSQKREKSQAETQPLDFSSGSSGLFDGSKAPEAIENKS